MKIGKRIKKGQKFEMGKIIDWSKCYLKCPQLKKFTEECFICPLKNYAPEYEQVDITTEEFIGYFKPLILESGCLMAKQESWDALRDAFVFNFKSYGNLYAEYDDFLLSIVRFNKNTERVGRRYTINFSNDERYGKVTNVNWGEEDKNAKRIADKISKRMFEIKERYLELFPQRKAQ